jgi:hypothetical protein
MLFARGRRPFTLVEEVRDCIRFDWGHPLIGAFGAPDGIEHHVMIGASGSALGACEVWSERYRVNLTLRDWLSLRMRRLC